MTAPPFSITRGNLRPDENREAELVLQFFGPCSIRCDGHPLPRLRTRKELWLLALLCLQGTREPIDRSRLAGMLWPEAREDRALANLRRSLTVVRDALGSQAGRLESPTPRSLRLDLAGAQCDVVDFDRAVRQNDDLSLRRAVGLYRGPLLADCFEEWVVPERETRQRAVLTALETLASQARQRSDLDGAADLLCRALQIDPLRESTVRTLMETLADQGNHAAAGEAFRTFRAELWRSLNAEPGTEIARLNRAILTDGRRRAEPVPSARESAGGDTNRADAAPLYRLPTELSQLIGRTAERDAVVAQLGDTRLVTLTGPGGIGKTRLSIAVAGEISAEFASGVCFVDLSPLSDPVLLPRLILGELGGTEPSGQTPATALEDFLRPKHLLLVLDNCEHLLSDCASLAQTLLRRCPHLRILATSREPFHAPAELVWPVPNLVHDEAMQLFAERAAQARFSFRMTEANAAAASRVCRRLEGMPLAIEMAAARTRGMPASQIAAELDDVLRLLDQRGGHLDPRQQTLRATLDWSYRLLDDPERALLARLSVFAGGWTLAMATAVCEGDLVPGDDMPDLMLSLVEKSLVEFAETAAGEGRYRFLETTRAYAAERLPPEERDRLLDRLASSFEHQAQRLLILQGAPEPGSEDTLLLSLEADLPNLRLALRWCHGRGEALRGLRIAAYLSKFWWTRDHITEGRQHIAMALQLESDDPDYVRVRAIALRASGVLAYFQWDFEPAQSYYEQALPLNRLLGDDGDTASVLLNLGLLFTAKGALPEARQRLQEALEIFRAIDSRHCVQKCLHSLANISVIEGDLESAQVQYEEVRRHYEAVGDLQNLAGSWFALATIMRKTAVQRPAESEVFVERERAYLRHSLQIRLVRGEAAYAAECLEALANSESQDDRTGYATRLYAASSALRESTDGTRLGSKAEGDIEAAIFKARGALGETAFETAWAEGRAMSMEQAVEYALIHSNPPAKR